MTVRVIEGLPMAAYLAEPAMSAGVICTLLDRCPAAALHESYKGPPKDPDGDEASDAGTVGHSILWENSEECVTVVGAPDWRTKEARMLRDAARAAGKSPVLAHKMPAIRAMVQSAREYGESLKVSEPAIWAALQPDGGASEVTVIWDEGVPCKLRCDRLSSDFAVILDAKFTTQSAEPDSYSCTRLAEMATRAAWYMRGCKAAFEVEPTYVYLIVEQDPPHLCSLIGCDPPTLEFGRERVERGLATWKECLATGDWPAYPARVCYPQMPGWLTAKWEEQQVDQDVFRERAHPPLSWPERLLLGTQP